MGPRAATATGTAAGAHALWIKYTVFYPSISEGRPKTTETPPQLGEHRRRMVMAAWRSAVSQRVHAARKNTPQIRSVHYTKQNLMLK